MENQFLLDMTASFFTGKKLHIFLHIAGWAILFILPSYFLYMDSSHDVLFLIRTYLHTIALAFVFYVNYVWLAPKLFFKEKKVHYFISAILLIAFTTLLFAFTNNQLNPKPEWEKEMDIQMQMRQDLSINKPPDMPSPDTKKPKPPKGWPIYNFLLNSFLITGFGLGLRFSDKMIQNDKKRKEAEKEKLNSELALLKNQISPHFFFNTLNNIYSLVQSNSGDAQKAILQLSKLMRYLIYESGEGSISLLKEIAFMNHYVDLMQLRINNDKVDLKVDFPELKEDISVHPLLFIPFIENAFKHGVSYRDQSFIHIKMKADNGILYFNCENSIGNRSESPVSSGSGIGLENIKKRLALLYPGKHTLDIRKSDREYSVSLEIVTL